jgi:uncharacterized protein (DUF1501 family)
MISRRVFLKHGSFALVSLGFAPSFLARTAFAAHPARRSKRLIAIFPARCRGRLERGGAVRRKRLLPSAADDRDRAAESQDTAALDLDGFFGFNPRLAPLKPLWDRRDLASCTRADHRIHTVPLRCAGLHGVGTPGVKSTGDGG